MTNIDEVAARLAGAFVSMRLLHGKTRTEKFSLFAYQVFDQGAAGVRARCMLGVIEIGVSMKDGWDKAKVARHIRSTMQICPERPEDVDAIRTLTIAAFRDMPHSSQTESAIVDALRGAGVLTVSLVAIQQDEIVGHVAFSPVTINGKFSGWYGLGPVSVWPTQQRKGIGQALIREGLDRLEQLGAQGCVVLGDPIYYSRFGFASDPDLRYGDVPPEYFQRLAFGDAMPKGEVAYHVGFDAA